MKYMKTCYHCGTQLNNETPCPNCHNRIFTESSEPWHLPIGSKINGRYLVGHALGCGGFGVTYLAEDTNLHTKVAIKEYLPQTICIRRGDSSVYASCKNDEEIYQWVLVDLT